ncbi:hypothetical protein D9M72_275630 [compost metagenome]
MEHRLLPGQHIDRGHHAGQDGYLHGTAAWPVVARAHAHQVVAFGALARALRCQRIGADMLHGAGKTAIDRKVVGRQLDHRRLAGPQEGNVGRPHARLDQQRVFQRDDLQQVHAGLHHAAHGIDLDLLDDAGKRGAHQGTVDAVLQRRVGGALRGLFGLGLVEFLHGLGAIMRAQFVGLLLALAVGGLQARHGKPRGLELAFQVIGLALQPQQVDLGHHALRHHRAHHGQLLCHQPMALPQLLLARALLGQLLPPLLGLLAQHGEIGIERALARLEQRALLGHEAAALGIGRRARHERRAVGLGAQARNACHQRIVPGAAFLVGSREAGIVDAHQRLVLVHHLPRSHHDLGDDPAFEVLHHLHLARRDHLALAHGHLVHPRQRGPGQRHQHEDQGGPEDPVREIARLRQRGRIALAHEGGVVGTRPQRSDQAPRRSHALRIRLKRHGASSPRARSGLRPWDHRPRYGPGPSRSGDRPG